MAYKYITDNNLYKKQTYMYSEYKGMLFFKEYLDSRQAFLEQNGFEKTDNAARENINNPVQKNLLDLKKSMESGKYDKETVYLINAYTKSFEVRKRVYTEYDDSWKPLSNEDFSDIKNYLLFADCLLLAYRNLKCMKYFNCLLKVVDTLLSIQDQIDCQWKRHFSYIIRQELDIVYEIAIENGIRLGDSE